jgi:hypothetical protein
MSYQFSYSFDDRVCGPVAMYEPVDPNWMYKGRSLRPAYKETAYNEIREEYDWDDSYQL